MASDNKSRQQPDLLSDQLGRLRQEHFLVLLWAASCEDRRVKYNITNCFDDLKSSGITRTKQTAVAVVEAMHLLCFIDIREERNRKNIYITNYGASALENLVSNGTFKILNSHYLEENKE
ncbi:MAG: hypothetical protein J6S21_00390 [Victivallales bacterium]|nr:hypothetical protein [Victivallales bacterium]